MITEETMKLLANVVRELVLDRQRAGYCNVGLRGAAHGFLAVLRRDKDLAAKPTTGEDDDDWSPFEPHVFDPMCPCVMCRRQNTAPPPGDTEKLARELLEAGWPGYSRSEMIHTQDKCGMHRLATYVRTMIDKAVKNAELAMKSWKAETAHATEIARLEKQHAVEIKAAVLVEFERSTEEAVTQQQIEIEELRQRYLLEIKEARRVALVDACKAVCSGCEWSNAEVKDSWWTAPDPGGPSDPIRKLIAEMDSAKKCKE